MSFLDSLEDSVKAMEGRDGGQEDNHRQIAAAKAAAVASAPWADKLKRGPFAAELVQLATREGFKRRAKVNLLWLGTTLRLEARGLRLELRPQAEGIDAVFLTGPQEDSRTTIDLKGSPKKLLAEWLLRVDEQIELEKAAAALAPEPEDEEDADADV